MSLFLLTTINALPEQFRTGIEIDNKSGIAEKLISESFLTKENFTIALMLFKTVSNLGSYRVVDGYTVTNTICFDTEEDAQTIYSIIMAQRQKNSNDIGRTWTHPAEVIPVITTISEEEWFINIQPALINAHTPIDPDNLVLS
jgi:hypothetical protein